MNFKGMMIIFVLLMYKIKMTKSVSYSCSMVLIIVHAINKLIDL